MSMPLVDLAAEVDGAQQVINAASAVQTLRVAQYAGRDEEQDAGGAWVEVNPINPSPLLIPPEGER